MKIQGLLWVGVMLAAVACGSDDDGDGGGASSPAGQSCHAMCDAQYQDCPDSVATCRQLCDAVVQGLDADCQAKAKAWFDCGAGIEWTCQGLIASQLDSSQCQNELGPYTQCVGGSIGDGGP